MYNWVGCEPWCHPTTYFKSSGVTLAKTVFAEFFRKFEFCMWLLSWHRHFINSITFLDMLIITFLVKGQVMKRENRSKTEVETLFFFFFLPKFDLYFVYWASKEMITLIIIHFFFYIRTYKFQHYIHKMILSRNKTL